jgi:hypothetical protein
MDPKIIERQFYRFNLLERAILIILYFYDRKISKMKLAALLFLLSDKVKRLKDYINPYIYIGSLKLNDPFVNNIIEYSFNLKHFITVDYINDIISLTKRGHKNIKKLIKSFPKEELDAIKEIMEQYSNLSEKELIDLIIEKAKNSLIQ